VTRGAGLLIVVLCVLGGFEASVMASVPAPKITETPSKTSEKYSKQRVLYEQALTELRTGIGPRYRAIRAQLADYTLVQYLDYEALIGQLHDMKPHEAKAFLAEADETPLHDRFRHAYLLHKGRDRHWKSFLSVTEGAPRDVELQCYYYRAQRTVGDVD
jgi:soluble lytic murein transglycosylase